MAWTVLLYVTLLLILFVENLFNIILKYILKVFVLVFLSHPSTRYLMHLYSHCYWNVTVKKYNMTTLLLKEWDQNTFTPVVAVNYDSLRNNKNTLVSIQNIAHLNRAKFWNEVFCSFCSFVDQFVIFVWNSLFFPGWSLRRFVWTQTHKWMQVNWNCTMRLEAIFVPISSV
jgi:hypothetical protein